MQSKIINFDAFPKFLVPDNTYFECSHSLLTFFQCKPINWSCVHEHKEGVILVSIKGRMMHIFTSQNCLSTFKIGIND